MAATNPAQLGFQNGYRPQSGALAAIQTQDYMDATNRTFRDSDLQNQRDTLAYNQDVADGPLKAAQRDNALNAAQLEGESFKDGTNRQLALAKKQSEISQALSTKSAADLDAMRSETGWYLGASEAMKDFGPADRTPDSPKWQAMVQAGRAAGMKENKIPSQWSPEAEAKIHSLAQMATFTQPLIGKMILQKQENEAKKGMADEKNKTSIKVAEIGRDAAIGRIDGAMDPDKLIEKRIDRKVETGQPITEEEVRTLATTHENKLKSQPPARFKEEKSDLLNELRAHYPGDMKYIAAEAKKVGLGPDAKPNEIANASERLAYEADTRAYLADRLAKAIGVDGKPLVVNYRGASAPLTVGSAPGAASPAAGAASGMKIDPAVQAQRDQASLALLQGEQADPAHSNPRDQAALSKEVGMRQQTISKALAAIDEQIRQASVAGDFQKVQALMQGRQQLTSRGAPDPQDAEPVPSNPAHLQDGRLYRNAKGSVAMYRNGKFTTDY